MDLGPLRAAPLQTRLTPRPPRAGHPTRFPASRRTRTLLRAGVCTLLLGVMLLAAAVTSAGAAPPPMQLRTLVWVTDGAVHGPNMATLVQATPRTPAALIGQQLRTRPFGARGIVLDGFADDLTSLDVLRTRHGASFPSPWLDAGIAAVRARVEAWVQALAATGTTLDMVLVRCGATRNATQIDPYGAPAWQAIQADPRFAALRNGYGSHSLASDMAYNSPLRAGWNDRFAAQVDRALSQAVGDVVRAHFPYAVVVAEGRYTLPDTAGITARRMGGAFGTNDQVPLHAQGAMVDPFPGAVMLAANARTVAAATGRRVVPSLCAPAWPGDQGGIPALVDSPYWRELLYHLLAGNAQAVVIDRGRVTPREAAAISGLLSDVVMRTGGGVYQPYESEAYVDSESVLAGAMQANGQVYWRLTFAPGVERLQVTMADNTTTTLLPDSSGTGAWFQHDAAIPVVYVGQPFAAVYVPPSSGGGSSAPPDDQGDGDPVGEETGEEQEGNPSDGEENDPGDQGGQGGDQGDEGDQEEEGGQGGDGAPEFLLLYDNEPHPSFVPPVVNATKYLVTYQNNVDPTAVDTGLINPQLVIAEIQELIDAGWNTEWGMLEFEQPFQSILSAGPSHPSYAATMQTLVDNIRAVKAAFPHIKWTYYNMPVVPYWVLSRDWGFITEEQRQTLYADLSTKFGPLLDELDWVTPSVYDVYERALGAPGSWSGMQNSEEAWRRASVTAVRYHFESQGKPVPPILPTATAWFQGGGTATALKPIPIDEFCEDQIRPVMEAGADGVAMWGAMEYFLLVATHPTLPSGYMYCRNRFVQDYYPPGTSVNDVDWFAPATKDYIGGFLNQTLSDAMRAIENGGVPVVP